MRKKIVAGNWKMNNDLNEGLKLTSEIVGMVNDEVTDDVSVVIAAPFIHLTKVGDMLRGSDKLFLAAQNCSEHASGAFTGEISAPMLKSIQTDYVIIGHSERREYFKETNAQLGKKVDILLNHQLRPIFCCGESLEVREAETHVEFVCQQLTESLFHLEAESFKDVVLAYEPIWAIGTGRTASAQQAQDMHAAIRNHIANKFGQEIADNLTILYGGSCKPGNAPELFSQPDVDGGLIGGASLKSRDFVDIVKSY